jgi:iron complex outermembrane receptor protein
MSNLLNRFLCRHNNYIFIAPNGNQIAGNDVYDYLQENATLFGGEAGIHFHPHPLDWLHVTSSFESVTGKKQNGENLPLKSAINIEYVCFYFAIFLFNRCSM